jgi:diaminohydroxyphosphoribosylaminopyrimidine deaminase/5-amino-6-(5-phosphoribosylamino)uracil reductase
MTSESVADAAWQIVLDAGRAAAGLDAAGTPAAFTATAGGELRQADARDEQAVLNWRPQSGWESLLDAADRRHALLDLYLPIASATPSRPIIVGHLGQSLDGFIATHSGDSQFVTGPENILHLHRMRALCDAVVVGAGTVAADNPQLTTRQVSGPSPLRVVFDPARRLGADYRLFHDDAAATIYACAASLVEPGETHIGRAEVIGLPGSTSGVELGDLVRVLRERGCYRIFVEGGGVTVSAFLEADLLHRLHVAIAPLLIGDGRPAIRLTARPVLRDCRRPAYRVFRMGGDVLFDCDLVSEEEADDDAGDGAPVTRII